MHMKNIKHTHAYETKSSISHAYETKSSTTHAYEPESASLYYFHDLDLHFGA